ncbi:MAG: PHP domain-containing protein [Lachnospiraceae bacterium]|nr:PHP domain-containing protein [Lachnospiraceae bacterium]
MIPISYDMHLHSCLSPCGDDDMTPSNIVGMASVLGLDAIALTDHNTTKNCPAFLKMAEQFGLIAIPGMELTTAEEVHVLCYFGNLEDALSFDRYVEDKILPIPNNPQFFGNQILIDEEDEPCGTFDTLLISATSISFDQVFDLVKEYHGIMVPAHVDKSSTSLLSNLGMIPENAKFRIAELRHPERLAELQKQHPYLEKCHILSSSDAHRLDAMHEPVNFIHVEEKTAAGLFDALVKYERE